MGSQEVVVEVHEEPNVRPQRKPRRKDKVCSSESGEVLRVGAKPSRRWLAVELEKLLKQNQQLARCVKAKEEVEEGLRRAKGSLEKELNECRMKGGEEVVSLRTKNQQLAQDVLIMKQVLIKLNGELERYQDRLRSYNDNATYNYDSEKDVKRVRGPWLEGELGVLSPLLQAYEENLIEKEGLLADYKAQFERVCGQLKGLVEENRALREVSAHRADGKSEVVDTLRLQKEVSLLAQQNELLARQAKLHHRKMTETKESYLIRVNESSSERDEAVAKLQQSRTELNMLKGRFSVLQEEYESLKGESAKQIPQTVHLAYIAECKRLFEELKSRYDDERDSLVRRVSTLESAKSELERQLATLGPQYDQLCGKLKTLETTNSRFEEKLRVSESRLVASEKNKVSLRGQLVSVMAFSKELIVEQERLLKELSERAEEARAGFRLAGRVGHLRAQVEGVEREAVDKARVVEETFKAQGEVVNRLTVNFEKEINSLKNLLRRREEEIERLNNDKEGIKKELEIVWKAAGDIRDSSESDGKT